MGKNSLIKSTAKKTKKVENVAKAETIVEEKVVTQSAPDPASKSAATKKTDDVKTPSSPKKEAQPPVATKTESQPKTPPPVEKTPQPPEPPVTVTYDSPSGPTSGDPINKTLLVLAGCVLFLFILIIGASASNSSRYYIKKLPVGIEILKGRFAPLGEEKVMALPDIEAPLEEKPVYKRAEVYPLIFQHYLKKADALLAEPGMPDYESIRNHLTKAQNYAVTNELSQTASKRLTAIDLNNLLYRAGVAQDQDTIEALETAQGYLAEAARLELDTDQLDRITLQRDTIRDRLRELKEIEAALEAMPQEPEALEITH